MSSSFSFSFAGDDIDHDIEDDAVPSSVSRQAAETGSLRKPSNSAFPIAGQPLLEPKIHDLDEMLLLLPSKIAYSTLSITLDDGSALHIPRRELWDVRVQLMAEDDEVGLGKDDVKTGVYEGGFKSWESSVDLVKEMAKRKGVWGRAEARRILELGCGTALPSLAILQWQLAEKLPELNLGFADYNPTVLQLVTVPNILLSWAQHEHGSSWDLEGELEIDEELLTMFRDSMMTNEISLSFFSGAWSPAFVKNIASKPIIPHSSLLVLGAETIYSPMALQSFTETLMDILDSEVPGNNSALIGAKKVYFGVGGSIEDFCEAVRSRKGHVNQVREESDGVRRAVVEIISG